jgi:hypothetical protein
VQKHEGRDRNLCANCALPAFLQKFSGVSVQLESFTGRLDEREFIAKPAQYLNMLIAWPLGLPVGVAVASEFSVVNSAVTARIEPSNGFWPINSSFDCRGHDRRTDRLR